jgi:uncharacterized membrane protein
MIDTLRPFASRIIASIVAAFASYLLIHYGVTLDADTQVGLQSVAFAIFGVVYGVLHKLLDKNVNPSDSASAHLAVEITRASAVAASPAAEPVAPVVGP